jgi:cytidylate kinase
MNARIPAEQISAAAVQALLHGQLRDSSEKGATGVKGPPPLTIAISRQRGAGGANVARALGDRLGWPVYDRDLLEKIAQEMGLRPELIRRVDERHASWLEETLDNVTARRTISPEAYVHYLVQVLESLAALGHCVIVGRGAAQFLPEASTLRVRLVGPLEKRVAAIQGWDGLSLAAAQYEVKDKDQRRRRFVLDFFHKDPDDPTLYDLILNSGRLSLDDCTDLILEALQRLEKARALSAPALAGVG